MKYTVKNINEYILLFPDEVQQKLIELRETIHSEMTGLEEYIGYQMPAFKYKGKPFVYFAGYKKHIGFYPGPEAIGVFEKDFNKKQYKFSKGAVQFPVDQDIPMELVRKIVQFRANEIDQKNPETFIPGFPFYFAQYLLLR
ncbi:iron chaperone [Chryseobacterium sp. DT-3]|uniref:iron chaperone n=1 Tax=Chryseobacterium sp. DT-3 TaxID=3396164 RepID=UPI003F19D651